MADTGAGCDTCPRTDPCPAVEAIDIRERGRRRPHLEQAAGVTPGRENGFHQLRHHFASTVLHDGVDIRALAEYLGHADPGFTLRVYTHLMPGSPDRMRQAIDRAFSDSPGLPQGVNQAAELRRHHFTKI